MKAAAIISILLLTALLAGCGESPNEEYQNIADADWAAGKPIHFSLNWRI